MKKDREKVLGKFRSSVRLPLARIEDIICLQIQNLRNNNIPHQIQRCSIKIIIGKIFLALGIPLGILLLLAIGIYLAIMESNTVYWKSTGEYF